MDIFWNSPIRIREMIVIAITLMFSLRSKDHNYYIATLEVNDHYDPYYLEVNGPYSSFLMSCLKTRLWGIMAAFSRDNCK